MTDQLHVPHPREFSVPRWIWEDTPDVPALDLKERAVLTNLYYRAYGSTVCWPGYEKIGLDCGISEKSVRRALEGLQEKGVIKISHWATEPKTGKTVSSLYEIKGLVNMATPPPEAEEVRSDCPGGPVNLTDKSGQNDQQNKEQEKPLRKAAAADPFEMVGELEGAGMDHETALRLAQNHPTEETRIQMDSWTSENKRRAKGGKQPYGVGWLISAIEKGYAPRRPKKKNEKTMAVYEILKHRLLDDGHADEHGDTVHEKTGSHAGWYIQAGHKQFVPYDLVGCLDDLKDGRAKEFFDTEQEFYRAESVGSVLFVDGVKQ